jgi:hypothetical protein
MARGDCLENFKLVVELRVLVCNFLGIFHSFLFHLIPHLLFVRFSGVLVNEDKNQIFNSLEVQIKFFCGRKILSPEVVNF